MRKYLHLNVNALITTALVTICTSSIAVAGEGLVRRSLVAEPLDAAHFSLRSGTDLTKDDMQLDEERWPAIIPSGIVASVEKLQEGVTSKRLVKSWRKTGKTPDQVFTILGLQNINDNLLTSTAFLQWEKFMKHFKREKMLDVMLDQMGGEAGVAKAIAYEKGDTAVDLERILRKRWVERKETPENTFKILLGGVSVTEQLDSPLLKMWSLSVKDYFPTFLTRVYPKMIEVLLKSNKDGSGDLVKALKIRYAADEDSLAGKLYKNWESRNTFLRS